MMTGYLIDGAVRTCEGLSDTGGGIFYFITKMKPDTIIHVHNKGP